MKGYLQLENSDVYEGELKGYAPANEAAEVVFNTSMCGYQEIITDPSYQSQIVTLTYPLIGNYGTSFDYEESDGCKISGLIVKELCEDPNHFNNEMRLDDYLKLNKVCALTGVDTRRLTRAIRNKGVMRGIITPRLLTYGELMKKINAFDDSNVVSKVSTKDIYQYSDTGEIHLAVMDFGIKRNILNNLKKWGCKLTVFPYNATTEQILAINPDGIFLSNGPGDPANVSCAIKTIRELIGKKPIVGICMGHQLACLALGGKTRKLKFGHRGGNHPVKSLHSGRVMITSQNHGYVVDDLPQGVNPSHVNVNDGTNEGINSRDKKIFTVQFHPEAFAGPMDSNYLFEKFIRFVRESQ